MTKVCKYPIDTNNLITTITGPIVKVLCIKNQPGQGCYAWVEVNSNAKEAELYIISIRTEQEMLDEDLDNAWHISSVIDNGEEWHFYCSIRKPVERQASTYNFEVGF